MTKLTTSRLSIAIFLIGATFFAAPVIYGQQTTEQFVPIGQSPGVSNKYSYIGKIVEVDLEANTITVESDRGTKTMKILTTTRIWLDRSKVKNANTVADYSDCEVGRSVEVMYDHDNHDVADWIKIESK